MLEQRTNLKGAVLLLLVFFLITAARFSSAYASTQARVEVADYVKRAILAYEEKRFNEALKNLREALRLNPESVDALYYQGLVFIALKRPADAQAALEKARELRPGDFDVAFQLGVLYFNLQEYEKAEPLLRQVYGAQPRRPNLGYYLGFIEYRKKNYREAIKLLHAAIPSDDNFAQLTRFYAGLAMSALGFPREAQAEIEEALRLQPVSPLTTPAQRFGEVLERAAERERFFRGELRLGVYYDTNVPVVPNASSDIVGQTIRETRERRDSEGELASLNLSYTWLRKLDRETAGEWEGNVSYRFFQTYNNHLPEFNTQSHTPTVGITRRGSVPSLFGDLSYFAGGQLTYDFISLGNLNKANKSRGDHTKRFVQRWIFNPYVTLEENPWNMTNLQFRFQWKDFFNDRDLSDRREVRDAKNYMIGLLHFVLFEQGRHYVKLGYQYDAERAEGENWTYRGNRFLFGGQYTLPWWDIRLRYDLDFQWRFHRHQHSLIPATAPGTTKRRDREPIHLVSVAKDFLYGAQNFTVSLDYLFDNNNSNLKPFDYTRHVITTSLTWHF